MHLIQKIIEPKRLLIIWQALQNEIGTGKRYIVGELEHQHNNTLLRYYLNTPDFKDAIALGFKGFVFFDLNQEIHDLNVMGALARRIPPRERTDFDDFLRYNRIEPSVGRTMSDFALLGYTGGKLP